MNTPLILLSLVTLQKTAARLKDNDPSIAAPYNNLIEKADEALSAGPFSVMDKKKTPPSGDKHDYMSMGPYWWPNPDTPDGLPYIRRDGEINPETSDEGTDRPRLQKMINAISNLALAFYFSKYEKYAEHAAHLARTWFLNPQTRMNPHLKFSQGIPGICDGRDIGIIDTSGLTSLFDHISLLEDSNCWKEDDQTSLKKWSQEFLHWLLTSENGRGEAKKHNNHGTWYDVQAAYHSLYTENPAKARKILTNTEKRLISHIEPDGSQPHELERTKSLSYSIMNLNGLMLCAVMGKQVGIDYWNYVTQDGRGSIRKAVEFLLKNAPVDNIDLWPYPQISPIKLGGYDSILLRAESNFQDKPFESTSKLLCQNHEEVPKNISRLII